MSERIRTRESTGKLAGFIFFATNPAMPGIVRVGRTQRWPQYRTEELYSTSVPEPFSCEAYKFFVDCYTAFEKISASLDILGLPCSKAGFFQIEEDLAIDVLNSHYVTQHIYTEDYKVEAQLAFQYALVESRTDWMELIIETLQCLPKAEKEAELLSMLAATFLVNSEPYAQWIASKFRPDPNIPLPLDEYEVAVKGRIYRFTAYENAIFHGYKNLEKHLESNGCSLFSSNALCWVIDYLINSGKEDWHKKDMTRFGVELIKRKANIKQFLHTGLLSERPRRITSQYFTYRIFPRNTSKTCEEVIRMLAHEDPNFADLLRAMQEAC